MWKGGCEGAEEVGERREQVPCYIRSCAFVVQIERSVTV